MDFKAFEETNSEASADEEGSEEEEGEEQESEVSDGWLPHAQTPVPFGRNPLSLLLDLPSLMVRLAPPPSCSRPKKHEGRREANHKRGEI